MNLVQHSAIDVHLVGATQDSSQDVARAQSSRVTSKLARRSANAICLYMLTSRRCALLWVMLASLELLRQHRPCRTPSSLSARETSLSVSQSMSGMLMICTGCSIQVLGFGLLVQIISLGNTYSGSSFVPQYIDRVSVSCMASTLEMTSPRDASSPEGIWGNCAMQDGTCCLAM